MRSAPTADADACCPHARDAAAVLADLGADADVGLHADDAARRLAAYGPNVLPSAPPERWWRKLARQFADPLVTLLLFADLISLAAWAVEGSVGFPVDAVVIAAILVANAVIGLVQEAKAADAVAALARMTAATSTVVRDARLLTVPSERVVPGDILVLAEGDAVGADGRLLSATGLTVQEASLTGESAAVVKDVRTLAPETTLGDRADMVHKGTAVVEGVGRAVVTATGMRTEMGSIAQLLEDTCSQPSPLQVELARVSKALGGLVVLVAVLTMGAMYAVTRPESAAGVVDILLTGVSLAVAAVPEGLVAILSLVLAVGVRAMARRNAVMTDLHSVETLGCASVICSDKTGTLTRNEMTLRTIWTASGRVSLGGTGYVPEGEVRVVDAGASDLAGSGDPSAHPDVMAEARTVLVGGAVANNAQFTEDDGQWRVQGDPTEAAFLVAQHKIDGVLERVGEYGRLAEVPFTSDRKMMSVLARHPTREQTRVFAKGAPDVLLGLCRWQRRGEGVVPLTEADRAEVGRRIDALSDQGYRTLAVAYRVLHPEPDGVPAHADDVERDLVFAGVVGLLDPPREQARTAVAEARRAGIRPVMITGDHPLTARRVGVDLGIVGHGDAPLTGAQLDELDGDAFAGAVRQVGVFARVAPRHKLRIVDALRGDGQVVAMTGDGVNDAPALKSADIGIAMGITGTEVTKESAQMILGDDDFATIVSAVRQGRVIYDNVAKFLRYLLSSNLGEVVTVLGGVLVGGLIGLRGGDGRAVVPLLATQILWVNLVTDSGPALAMGVDSEIDDVMARPPRPRTARLLDAGAWVHIGWVGLLMGVVTLLAVDIALPGGLVEGGADVTTARTAGFTTLVLAQLVNAFSSRSRTRSAFAVVRANWWLWAAVALGVVLQVAVVHLPALQSAFSTTALSLSQWLSCLGLASVPLLAQELLKAAGRHRMRARPADAVS